LVFLNAGGNVGAREPIEIVESQAWIKTVEISLFAAFHVPKASIPLLKMSDNGQILTMGTGTGRRPDKSSAPDSAAKAALWMLKQTISTELTDY
tara:strand:+ start:268 stop:549 length:282 start_codon:yes stop_codon:yes gene_type:complete